MGVMGVRQQRLIREDAKGGCWLKTAVSGVRVFLVGGGWISSPRQLGSGRGALSPSCCHTQTSTSSEAPPLSWPVGSTTETSGGADLSDSLSSGGVAAQPPPRKVKVHDVLGCLLTGDGSLSLAGLRVVDGLRIVRCYPCLWAGCLLVGWVSSCRWHGGRPECHPSTQSQSRVRVRRASISEPSDTDLEPRTLDPSPAGKSALLPSLPRPSPVFPIFQLGGILVLVECSVIEGLLAFPFSS